VFCAGTAGIMLGAIVSFQLMKLIHPETVAGDTWAGMAALAGSWIGGGANMVAMREVFGTDATTFGQFAVVDVACRQPVDGDPAVPGQPRAADRYPQRCRYPCHRRDEGAHQRLRGAERAHSQHDRPDGDRRRGLGVGLAHAIAAPLAGWFKANVSWASQFSLDEPVRVGDPAVHRDGPGLSFTRARRLEAAGASRLGTVFLYFLIACIGMQMNLLSLLDRPWLFLLGAIWMATHVLVLWVVAKLLRAPLFFFAIGSQGNIGAAAPAPVVAAAFIRRWPRWACCWARWAMRPAQHWRPVTGLILKWMANG
jgi:hypothetical protein